MDLSFPLVLCLFQIVSPQNYFLLKIVKMTLVRVVSHNEIIKSIAITARKTITTVIVTMSLKRYSAVLRIQ